MLYTLNLHIATLKRIGNVAVILIEHDIQQILVNGLTERPKSNALVFFAANNDGRIASHLGIQLLREVVRVLLGIPVVVRTELIDKFLNWIGVPELMGCQKTRVVTDVVIEPALLKGLAIVIGKGN